MNYILSKESMLQCLNAVDILAAVVGCIIHDFAHPGVNNTYLMNSSDELAILYNDKSILENHHASASFKIMLQPDCNILSGVDRTQYKQIRESILNNVLATDAAQHFDYLGKFKAKLAAGDFDMEDDADRRMVTSFATKCADMNNPTRPSKLSREWTERIMNEFFMQGDQEAKLNIPVSMFMDRNNTDIPKCRKSGLEARWC